MKQLLRRHPDVVPACGLFLVFSAVFSVWPQLDLLLAAQFYVPGSGFPAGAQWWIRLTYVAVAKFWIIAPVCLLVLLVGYLPRVGKRWAPWRTMSAYLLAVLLVGPGLIANTLLKDNWGRPRPIHLTEFGGNATFTPVLQPSTQCATNCSFVSGHAAAGFYPMAGYWLTRRRRWLAGGIVFGLFVGYTRLAMGAHFLSDVLFSGLVVYFTCVCAALFFRIRPAAVPAPASASMNVPGMAFKPGEP